MVDSFKELGEVLISIRDEIRGVHALLARIGDRLEKTAASPMAAAPVEAAAAPVEAAAKRDEPVPAAEPAPEPETPPAGMPEVSPDFASFAVELREGAEPASKADIDGLAASAGGSAAEPSRESEPDGAGTPPDEIDAFPMELLAQAASDEPAPAAAEEPAPEPQPVDPEAPPSDDDLISLLSQVAPAKPPRARAADPAPGSAPAVTPTSAHGRAEKVSAEKFDLSNDELDEILKG